MPRPPKDYSLPTPYIPGPPPVKGSTSEEIVRATWDEFHRIAALLADPAAVLPLGVPDADQPD